MTRMAGFRTVQNPGSSAAVPLHNAIAKGLLPGPRILTAVEPLMGQGEKAGETLPHQRRMLTHDGSVSPTTWQEA